MIKVDGDVVINTQLCQECLRGEKIGYLNGRAITDLNEVIKNLTQRRIPHLTAITTDSDFRLMKLLVLTFGAINTSFMIASTVFMFVVGPIKFAVIGSLGSVMTLAPGRLFIVSIN